MKIDIDMAVKTAPSVGVSGAFLAQMFCATAEEWAGALLRAKQLGDQLFDEFYDDWHTGPIGEVHIIRQGAVAYAYMIGTRGDWSSIAFAAAATDDEATLPPGPWLVRHNGK